VNVGPGPVPIYRGPMANAQQQPMPPVAGNVNSSPIPNPAVAAQLLQLQMQLRGNPMGKEVAINAPSSVMAVPSIPPLMNQQRPTQSISPYTPQSVPPMSKFPQDHSHMPGNSMNLHDYIAPQQTPQQQLFYQQRRQQQQLQQQQQQMQQEQTLYSGAPLFRRTGPGGPGPVNNQGGGITFNNYASSGSTNTYGMKDELSPMGHMGRGGMDGTNNLIPNNHGVINSNNIGSNRGGSMNQNNLENRFANWTPFPPETLGLGAAASAAAALLSQRNNMSSSASSNASSGFGSNNMMFGQHTPSAMLGRGDSLGLNSGSSSASMLDSNYSLGMGMNNGGSPIRGHGPISTSSMSGSSGVSSMNSGWSRNLESWGANDGLNSVSPPAMGMGRNYSQIQQQQTQQHNMHHSMLQPQQNNDDIRNSQIFVGNLTAELSNPMLRGNGGMGLGGNYMGGNNSGRGDLGLGRREREDSGGDERSYANVVKKASSAAAVGAALSGGSPNKGVGHSLFMHQ